MDGRKRANVKDSEDIFSKLPDTIFHDILSLLPTKDAVRTSILSRRWLSLWTYSTNIDLNYCLINDRMSRAPNSTQPSFVDFVERVLLLCDAPYLEKLCLSSTMKISAFRVSSWISSAIKHNVQKLDLNLWSKDDFVLPHCFFSGKSLTAVKLHRFCFSKIPSSVCLPNLKTLHLAYVTFLDEQSTQKFFSSLPVLQDLVLCGCFWSNMKNVTINSLSLKSLSFSNDEACDCEINIYASNLSSFHCELNLEFKLLFLHDMELLDDAFIDLYNEDYEDFTMGINVFRNVHCIKSLSVSDTTLRILCMEVNLEIRLPIFNNLNRLVVNSEFDCEDGRGLTTLLQRSPNLEFLDMEGLTDSNFEECYWSLKSDPPWFKSSLKKLRISDFTGNEGETNFIKFMLKNFPLLKNIELVRKQVDTFPQGSSNCVIEMS